MRLAYWRARSRDRKFFRVRLFLSDYELFRRPCSGATPKPSRDARAALNSSIAWYTTKKERPHYRSFSAFRLDDYLNETSSIRKVVDSEKSVVDRNCNRIVWPLYEAKLNDFCE